MIEKGKRWVNLRDELPASESELRIAEAYDKASADTRTNAEIYASVKDSTMMKIMRANGCCASCAEGYGVWNYAGLDIDKLPPLPEKCSECGRKI